MTSKYQPVFAKDAAINFGSQIFALCITFVTGTLIARQVGPQGNGTYSLCVLIPTLTAALISLGMNYANVFLIRKRGLPTGNVVGSTAFFSLITGVFGTLILLGFVPLFNRVFLKDNASSYLYFTIPFITILLLLEIFTSALLAHRNMLKWGMAQSARPLVYMTLLLLFYYGTGTLTVGRILTAYLGGLLFTFAAFCFFFWESGYATGWGVDKTVIKDAISFGAKQHIGTISQLLNYRLDALLVAGLLTREDVGLYALAVMMGETIWYIPNAIGQILFSKVSASQNNESNQVTPVVCRNTWLISFLAAVFLWVIAEPLIPWLFKPQFLPSVTALRWLLPGILFLTLSKVLGSDLVGRGFPHYTTYASLASLCVNVFFNILFIPRLGINGASLASSLTYLTHALIVLYYFKKVSGVPLGDVLVFKKSDFLYYREQLQRVLGGCHG